MDQLFWQYFQNLTRHWLTSPICTLFHTPHLVKPTKLITFDSTAGSRTRGNYLNFLFKFHIFSCPNEKESFSHISIVKLVTKRFSWLCVTLILKWITTSASPSRFRHDIV